MSDFSVIARYSSGDMAHGGPIAATIAQAEVPFGAVDILVNNAEICRLVALNLTDITVEGSWLGRGTEAKQ